MIFIYGVYIGLPEKSGAIMQNDGINSPIPREREENKSIGLNPDDLIFALDIGTRTVVGVVGVPQGNESFRVLAAEIAEHETRAMIDGQIHDIEKVSDTAKKIKESLENRLGIELSKVSIAAAGRVLLTSRVKVERDIGEDTVIDENIVSALTMEGIQKAQRHLEAEILKSERNQFHCVGYTVVSYYLDDFIISELIGHKGYKIGADMLVTFLPHIVVDSLYAVMERIGLKVVNLTLEPIAAINIAIPKDLRLLNLALVDVGAGTSDIAITRNGTVCAYAMVSIAGDEITEAIAQHYLVDFNTAERIKISIKDKKAPIKITDVLDNEVTVSYEEVIESIRPVTRQLAESIAEKIIEYNGGKPPNAVFLVGGGSQTEGLSKLLSELLGLPESRVAVRNRSIAKNIIYDGDNLTGPECITPFGIMATSFLQRGQDFYYVTVNGKKVQLFNARRMTVSDALVILNYTPEQLIAKAGKSLRFVLNGQPKTIKGSLGRPAKIEVNGKTANLGTHLRIGDKITIKKAVNGRDAVLKAGDLIDTVPSLCVKTGDDKYYLPNKLFLNGEPASPDAKVNGNDDLRISSSYTVEEIINVLRINTDEYIILVDGKQAPGDKKVNASNDVQCVKKKKTEVQEPGSIYKYNEKPLQTGLKVAHSYETGSNADNKNEGKQEGFYVSVNGKPVFIENSDKHHLFTDIFNYIDFDISKPQGIVVLKLNGKDARFTDPIKAGDTIQIYWEK